MAKIRIFLLLLFIGSLLNTGCTLKGKKQDQWKPIDHHKAPVVHEVQWKSETLSIIAKWYTGETKNWVSLADANPNINPDLLSLGNRIFIPSHLVKTNDPMTKEFVAKFYEQLNKKKTPVVSKKPPKKKISQKKEPETAPEPVDAFEVIGPK